MCVAAAVAAEVLVVEVALELVVKLIMELEVRVKIRQLKKLKVFNSLRLFVVLLIAVCY